MSKLTISQMIAGLQDLTRDELTELNQNLILVARTKSREIKQEKAALVSFKPQIGDVISFIKSGRGRNAGMNYFIFQRMNRANIGMQGPACDSAGKQLPLAATWTVDITQPTVKLHMRNGQRV